MAAKPSAAGLESGIHLILAASTASRRVEGKTSRRIYTPAAMFIHESPDRA
jgi:hypothetical protein